MIIICSGIQTMSNELKPVYVWGEGKANSTKVLPPNARSLATL